MNKPTSSQPRTRAGAGRPVRSSPLATAPGRWHAALSFPIVGIGASAGGLEALAQFFKHVPADSGMAFVVIQHLDPTQKGMMVELLQRVAAIKVMQVKDRTNVRPNCVYLIPPNSDMSLLHGTLHLLAPTAPRGLRLPIDHFFCSLAEDRQERGIGVVLSGMGRDGTLGLQAIKSKSGLALVQDPATAKFDAMPRSAIDGGAADFVASAEALPGTLIAHLRGLPQVRNANSPPVGKVQGALEKITVLLRSHTGHDFSLYRRSTLHRRVERRMGIHQISQIGAYVRYLQVNTQELGILFKELLIGVTRFFRDTAAWQQLAKRALPSLLASRPAASGLRAWVVGCSTGEEAYSLAIVFTEVLKRIKPSHNRTLQIYATDLDKDAIDKARQGLFPESIRADVSPARLARYFVKEPNGYRVAKAIRSMVVFAPQNLIMDPPFTKLDVLCCRNLLIYLTPELQKKLFPLFHYSLKPNGVLFLGSSESVGGFAHLFRPLAPRERLFRRNESVLIANQLDIPAVFIPPPAARAEPSPGTRIPVPSLQSLADQFLQARFAPPAVLVNYAGDILYINGRTGTYLEPAAGKANWNVLAMAREELRNDLAAAVNKVRRDGGSVAVRGIKVGRGPQAHIVDLSVQAMEEPKELVGMVLIVFTEAVEPAAGGPQAGSGKPRHRTLRQSDLAAQLQHAREEVRAGREEMQTSQEELRSMNEELQSTNEELQSANEELTTSKEEMQSLNEELQTVNAELQAKLDELSAADNDMKNLLNSTDIATVFLDNELRVRRFTLQAKTIIKFIAGDLGRPITDLASDLLYPALVADATEVLRTLAFVERSITTEDGRWFTVRIMPYRTMDDRINGLVITFANITGAKKVETELREKLAALARHSARPGLELESSLEHPRAGDTLPRLGRPAKRGLRPPAGAAGSPQP